VFRLRNGSPERRFQDRHSGSANSVDITRPPSERPVKTATPLLVVTASIALAAPFGCGSPNRPATWAYISPVIMQPNCASQSCHSPGVAAAGLDFSDPDVGYSSLTRLWVWIVEPSKKGEAGCEQRAGTTVCEEPFRPLVTAYDPAQSRLIDLLRGRNAPRMPPDRPLDEADIELVEDWILNGAKKSETDVNDSGLGGVTDAAPNTEAGDGADALDDGSDAPGADGGDAFGDAFTDGSGGGDGGSG
jgi:hypothetical protein